MPLLSPISPFHAGTRFGRHRGSPPRAAPLQDLPLRPWSPANEAGKAWKFFDAPKSETLKLKREEEVWPVTRVLV